MSEAQQLRWMALGLLIGAIIFSAAFVASGFDLAFMLVAAVALVGAFMAFGLSFAA